MQQQPDPGAVELSRATMSIGDAAAYIGVSRATVYRLLKSGKLKARKLGHRTLLMKSELTSFLDDLPTT